MLEVIACLVGVFVLLVIDDILARAKILKAEYRRKFVHITVGTFVASWPWIISWRSIQIIGILMFAIVAFNQYRPIFKFNRGLKRETYGDYFFALAIVVCALLTSTKVFFAMAILNLALADGLAALAGSSSGKRWKYKVFNQTKTVIGSMAFWFTSLIILGGGTLFAHELISFNHYVILLLLLPPALTLVENAAVYGLDNLAVPVIVLLALHIAETA